jgi:hypothetical protein
MAATEATKAESAPLMQNPKASTKNEDDDNNNTIRSGGGPTPRSRLAAAAAAAAAALVVVAALAAIVSSATPSSATAAGLTRRQGLGAGLGGLGGLGEFQLPVTKTAVDPTKRLAFFLGAEGTGHHFFVKGRNTGPLNLGMGRDFCAADALAGSPAAADMCEMCTVRQCQLLTKDISPELFDDVRLGEAHLYDFVMPGTGKRSEVGGLCTSRIQEVVGSNPAAANMCETCAVRQLTYLVSTLEPIK